MAYRSEKLIWKLETDGPGGWLAVETRQPGSAGASFTTLNLHNGQTGISDFSPGAEWPCGLEGIRKGVLLLHGFEAENSPAHKGLMAFDALSGEALWNNFLWSADALFDDHFLAYDRRLIPFKYQAANWRNGKIMAQKEAKVSHRSNDDLLLPTKILAWPDHLAKPYDRQAAGLVDYLRLGSVEIISLHTQNSNAYDQQIFVFTNGRLTGSDLLNTGIQKLQPDAFLMQQNRLVYIRNKNEVLICDARSGETTHHDK